MCAAAQDGWKKMFSGDVSLVLYEKYKLDKSVAI